MTQDQADRLARIAAAWWHKLQPLAPGEDRGALARLRRAPTCLKAATEPDAIDLARRFGLGVNGVALAALVAPTIAHIRTNAQKTTLARMVGPGKSGSALMSWNRFRALLETREPDELMTAMRRAIALTNRSAPVFDVSRSLLDWSDERRQRWSYDYFTPADEAATVTEDAFK